METVPPASDKNGAEKLKMRKGDPIAGAPTVTASCFSLQQVLADWVSKVPMPDTAIAMFEYILLSRS